MDLSYYKRMEPIFGSWYIKEFLGEGNFGKVFKIVREDFGTEYTAALKVITIPKNESEIKSIMADGLDSNGVTAYYQGFVKEIVSEFTLMAKLKGNSNIVSYEDHMVIQHTDEIGWDILIRMELLTPLLDHIAKNSMSRKDVVQMGIDICRALEVCKKHEIIHRDIKPENIFISNSGYYKLGDFGIARTVEKTTSGLSKKGTYTYMAPEVYRGDDYGASVDLYSLGLVLFRLLNNNRAPFLPPHPQQITFTDREEALYKRMRGEAIPVPANADAQLAAIIQKACAYYPSDRYTSPEEMRHELERILSCQDTEAVCKADVYAAAKTGQNTVVGTDTGSATITSDSTVGLFSMNPVGKQAEEKKPPVESEKKEPVKPVEQKPQIRIRFISPEGLVLSDSMYTEGQRVTPPDVSRYEDGKRMVVWAPAVEERATKDMAYSAKIVAKADGEKKKRVFIPIIIGGAALLLVMLLLLIIGISQSKQKPNNPVREQPRPTVTRLEWSEWAKDLPAGITADNYAIEVKLQYRSVPLYRLAQNEELPEGAVRFENEYGEWGEWTAWQNQEIIATAATEVETQVVSQYIAPSAWTRTKLSGWNIETRQRSGNNLTTITEYRRTGYYTDVTQYRSRTRQVVSCYYIEGNWTEFQDTPIAYTDDELVHYQMLYRYASVPGGQIRRPSMNNFTVFNADYVGRFRDVDDDLWYGANKSDILRTVNELGILLPDSHMRFKPDENVSIGQALRAAVIINRIYNGYPSLLGVNDGSYDLYAAYAVENGICREGEFTDLTRKATRQELAYVLYNSLPAEMFGEKKNIDEITDMNMGYRYYDCVLTMAEAGIINLKENDEFRPEEMATRAELCSIIDKMIYSEHRN